MTAPSFAFDHKSIDGDPTELAMIWKASSVAGNGRLWEILFHYGRPKSRLEPGEMQTLHFHSIALRAAVDRPGPAAKKNVGSYENNEDMAELTAYLNKKFEWPPGAIWTWEANGWYPNDDLSNTLKAGVTQSVAHFQIGNQRFPIENMTRLWTG